MKKNFLKEVLKFRFEYFITVLVIVLFILSVIYVGFDEVCNIGFNICLFIMIPLTFYSIRLSRHMLYTVFIGKVKEHENK